MRLNHHRSGTGAPLVLIHGIGSRWQIWEPILARVAAERDLVALDLPGFGRSPMPPPGTPPGVPSLATLVDEFLTDELGLERPHVAGNSLGGWIALELARRGRASSATALSPAGFARGPDSAYARANLWLAVRAARALEKRADRLTRPVLGRRILFGTFVARPERIAPQDAAESLRALAQAPWFDDMLPAVVADRFRGGEEMRVPVTIAWGEKDRLLLPRQARRAARGLPSARMLTLTGCGHVPTYDDPEQIATVLLVGSSG